MSFFFFSCVLFFFPCVLFFFSPVSFFFFPCVLFFFFPVSFFFFPLCPFFFFPCVLFFFFPCVLFFFSRSTALYSSSPRNRSTSSSVCKAGALVSPSSCLDGEPHGWVPVDTHSTPVPSMTGEAVGGLCNVRAQSTTGKCATRTW